MRFVLATLRSAFRRFRHEPVFAATAVLILALGMGALISLLTLMNAVLFRPWPVPDPGSVVVISNAGGAPFPMSVAEYRFLAANSRTIAHMAGSDGGGERDVEDSGGRRFRASSTFVNADYFTALQVGMEAGQGIGIRMALGARARQIVGFVFATARPALVWGVAAGFVLSVASTPILRHFLYGFSPLDPIAWFEAAGIVGVTAALASWMPARRAARSDPAEILWSD
jgi:FtsX-like permease family